MPLGRPAIHTNEYEYSHLRLGFGLPDAVIVLVPCRQEPANDRQDFIMRLLKDPSATLASEPAGDSADAVTFAQQPQDDRFREHFRPYFPGASEALPTYFPSASIGLGGSGSGSGWK